jgi:two-component system OmpR family sensor kinase
VRSLSLRRRLLLGFALVALALVVGGFFLAATMRTALIDRVDRQLASVPPGGWPGPGGGGGDLLSEFVFAVFDLDGELVRITEPGLSRADEPLPDVEEMWALASRIEGNRAAVGNVSPESGGGADYRMRAQTARDLRTDDRYVVVYGQSLADVEETFDDIVLAEVLTATAVLLVLGVVGYWVLRQGVRPLDHIAETADAIAAGDLSRRVDQPAAGTEAGRVGAAFNRMLGQIEEDIRQREVAEQRLKRFVADASHELRTPLTSIRGYADLWRQGGLQGPAALDDAMTRIEGESARMGRLVDDLLLLARLDEGIPLQHVPVDLARVAHDMVADARVVDPGRSLSVDAPEPVVVIGDDDRLRQAVGNLVTNARTHTPVSAAVHVSVRRDGSDAVVVVRDEGPGMDADTASRVFERFFRADASRSRVQGGSGLGLAIVAAVVGALGGRVALDTAPGAGATFSIRIPLAPV